jgi:hypothetical protein
VGLAERKEAAMSRRGCSPRSVATMVEAAAAAAAYRSPFYHQVSATESSVS